MVFAEEKMKKMLFRYLLISSAVIFALISLVLSPLYSVLTSNIAFMYSLLPAAVLLLTDILNFVAMAICFSLIAYSIVRFSISSSTSLLITYIIAIFFKYTADMTVSYFILKRIAVYSILSSVGAFFIDLLLILIASLIAYKAHKKGSSLKQVAIGLGILLAITKVLSRAVYDFSVGPPADLLDLLWMITSYLSDLLVGAVFFVALYTIFKYLKKKETAD